MSKTLIPPDQNIQLLAGQALDITIPVIDRRGRKITVQGETVEFGISTSPTTAPTEFLPTVESGHEIKVTISSAKTIQLSGQQVYFTCWVTILGESTPVARGWLQTKESTRG